MDDHKKICIIIPYYGPWPDWFDYFLKSCMYNPSFNWVILSSNSIQSSVPENVHFINISLHELSLLIKRELGIIPQINHPYKLVDFKPAFGLIFRQELTNYEFWGYSDIDLIYGNIARFITYDITENYDIISPSKNFIPGHFALYRNIPKINTLFKNCKNWRSILTDSKCYCFDEKYVKNGFEINNLSIKNFISKNVFEHLVKSKYSENQLSYSLKNVIQPLYKSLLGKIKPLRDFNQIIHYHHKKKNIRLYFDQLYSDDIMKLRTGNKNYVIDWKQGSLYDLNNEIMYFHFQLSKYDDSFSIIESGIEEFKIIKT